MRVINTNEPIILFLGDILVLLVSLWLSLLLRYLEIPSLEVWTVHVYPFLILFIVWIGIFYISGLYEKHTSIFKNKIPVILFNAQIVSIVIAVIFFYAFPIFSIAPKTILFIFGIISFGLFWSFRILGYSRFFKNKQHKTLLIGEGLEVNDLYTEVNKNKHYELSFVHKISAQEYVEHDYRAILEQKVKEGEIEVIVIDLRDKKNETILPALYNLFLETIPVIDLLQVYEDVFDKTPLSLVQYEWFMQYLSISKKSIHDLGKRLLDILIALSGLIVFALLFPIIFTAIKIEDPRGSIFISQIRVGKNNRHIKIYKLRSMTRNEDGVWIGESTNQITRVGAFLRKSSIDEFPQFLNILKGDLSLIGPRPDMVGLESRLSQEIPYYAIRYIVKPGMSGWAQTRQDVIPNSIEENKERLAYDLFYIKNRSLLLDVQIIIKTIKTLLTRGGR